MVTDITFINENKSRFGVIFQGEEYSLELEYDGRDAFITFPMFSKIEITKWCELIIGLFDEQSNFKQNLFKTFWFLKSDKLECIFLVSKEL